MSPLAAKILIVGIPLLLSLGWFLYWVLRLAGARRQLKERPRNEQGDAP